MAKNQASPQASPEGKRRRNRCLKKIKNKVDEIKLVSTNAFGAVAPVSGDASFLVMPWCNTVCMNTFLEHLSKEYAQEEILLVCDGAAWHKSVALVVPDNIHLIHIPPYTPEMNPIEQVWREIRTRGFRNEVFQTLEKVIDRLCCTIRSITPETIRSITGREWILRLF